MYHSPAQRHLQSGLIGLCQQRNQNTFCAHLFGIDDAFDVFSEDRIHAEDSGQHGQPQESLPDPHLHLSLSPAAARLFLQLPESLPPARERAARSSAEREGKERGASTQPTLFLQLLKMDGWLDGW
ncbi:hypothetical protein ILYODFUR_020489 [Ilyodon furcidens]|uniref:Uncharacterized protein n=1 Tax=Ilyodon furcidens TaxID=33524 RepID=A0ABV0T1D4_9TELE